MFKDSATKYYPVADQYSFTNPEDGVATRWPDIPWTVTIQVPPGSTLTSFNNIMSLDLLYSGLSHDMWKTPLLEIFDLQLKTFSFKILFNESFKALGLDNDTALCNLVINDNYSPRFILVSKP